MEWRRGKKEGEYESSTGHKLLYAKLIGGGWGWYLTHANLLPGDCISVNRELSPYTPQAAIGWAEAQLPQEEQKFWIIWNPRGATPIKRHAYLNEARHEAERLSRHNPDQIFYVLRVVGKAVPPVYIEIQPTAFDKKELRKGEL